MSNLKIAKVHFFGIYEYLIMPPQHQLLLFTLRGGICEEGELVCKEEELVCKEEDLVCKEEDLVCKEEEKV